MAEINKEALSTVQTRRDDGAPPEILSITDPGPPVRMLHERGSTRGFDPLSYVGGFNPDRITIRQMELMRRDPQIRLGMHFRKVPVARAPWRADSDDPQLAAFITEVLRPVWDTLMVSMLGCLDFGYAPVVIPFKLDKPQWEYEDPATRERKPVWSEKEIDAVVLSTPRPLPPKGAKPIFTANGQSFDGIEHSGLSKSESKTDVLKVPVENSLWVINEFEESFGNWYGYPATGYAFRFWWSYWYHFLLGDNHFETDADPPLVVSYPPGTSPNPDLTDTMLANSEIALAAGQAIRSGDTVAISSEVYASEVDGRPTSVRKWEVDFMKGGENLAAFQASYEYLDIARLRAVLVPEQALVEGAKGTGSRNVAEVQGNALVESQAVTLAMLVKHVNQHIVPRLLEQNFIEPAPVRIVTEGLRPQDQEIMYELVRIIAANDPKALQLDTRRLLNQMSFPLLTEEQVREAKEEALQDAERQRAIFEKAGGAPEGQNKNADGSSSTGQQGARDQKNPQGTQGKGPQGETKRADARQAGPPPSKSGG
jgi:hypothetical protein